MARAGNRVEVLHGVNFDMLGKRDRDIYGDFSLRELELEIKGFAGELDLEPRFFQTNFEGEFVEHLHRLPEIADAAIVNAGAWTHYSWAIRDALEIAALPAVEIHLSDVAGREPWRRLSVVGDLCFATIAGQGPAGYREALTLVRARLEGEGA